MRSELYHSFRIYLITSRIFCNSDNLDNSNPIHGSSADIFTITIGFSMCLFYICYLYIITAL